MHQPTTVITIETPGLISTVITVTAATVVEVAEQEIGSTLYVGLLVGARFYPLVMWKHTVGRPEHLTAIEAARQAVADAAAALAAPALNALGEPMPASADEALARQLLSEIVENDDQAAAAYFRGERYTGEADALLAARVRKVQQLESIGYVLTQDADRQLCVTPAPRRADADPDAELDAREDALAARCSCFRGALLNGDNEHPACVAADRCLDQEPAPAPTELPTTTPMQAIATAMLSAQPHAYAVLCKTVTAHWPPMPQFDRREAAHEAIGAVWAWLVLAAVAGMRPRRAAERRAA